MINRRIGSFIAALRKEQHLTQEQFAEKLGVSNRSISRWENGSTLPDLSLMQSICQITGVTLGELLNGARRDPSTERKDSIYLILSLWDREKLEKIKRLNLWFSLGFIFLLSAVLCAGILSRGQTLLLIGPGIFFHGLGFYHNNRDPKLTGSEKAILAASGEAAAMRRPAQLLSFARKMQNVSLPQYKTAFHAICEKLADDERVCFAMVANEYSIDTAPGIWHAGIAVTQRRLFLSGETVAGRLMTRTVTDIYDTADILSIRHTNRSILLKTANATLTIKGDDVGPLAEAFKKAVLPEE